jgi:hypothetical protein
MQKSAKQGESRDQAISWLVSQLRWERMLGEFRGVHVDDTRGEAARAA